MLKKFLLHVFFVFLAFIAVWIIAANQKTEVFSKDDLRAISCGWPIKFMENDLSHRDPPYPWNMSCLEAEFNDPIKFFYWPQFIINILVFYTLIVLFWRVCIILINKIQQR